MASPEHDLEKGTPDIHSGAAPTEPQAIPDMASRGVSYISSRPLSINQPAYLETPHDPPYVNTTSTMTLAQTDTLQKFRNHLGIHNSDDLTTNRTAANLGIFPRIVSSEKTAHRQYQIFTWLINGALGLQIVFAAALTALGAGDGPRQAVTAFGAMNTILAGLLTFLKGSGLPNRLKYYENEWTKVREYIEQRERDFAHVTQIDHNLNLREEIAIIEHMYESVRHDIEANTPDGYISTSRHHTAAGATQSPSLARGLSVYSQKAQDRLSHVQDTTRDRLSYMQGGIDSRIHSTQNMASGGLQDARNYTESRIQLGRGAIDDEKAKYQSQIQTSVREVQSQADAQIRNIQEAADARVKEMQNTIKQSETKAKETEAKVLSSTEKAAEKVLNFIHHRKEGQ